MEELGLLLYDGMGELGLAAIVDPYTTSLTAHLHTVARSLEPVRSQHGLYFVPRSDFISAPHLDRILTPETGSGRCGLRGQHPRTWHG